MGLGKAVKSTEGFSEKMKTIFKHNIKAMEYGQHVLQSVTGRMVAAGKAIPRELHAIPITAALQG